MKLLEKLKRINFKDNFINEEFKEDGDEVLYYNKITLLFGEDAEYHSYFKMSAAATKIAKKKLKDKFKKSNQFSKLKLVDLKLYPSSTIFTVGKYPNGNNKYKITINYNAYFKKV